MSRIADEIENRRGLVLGLTLAELLLLLLFLLLLALTWQMSRLKEEAIFERGKAADLTAKLQTMEASIRYLEPLIIEFKKKGGRLNNETVQALVQKVGRVEMLETELSDLKESKRQLMAEFMALKATTADNKKLQKFDEAINAASHIDPSDPPAVLVRAVEILEKLGRNTRPDEVTSLTDVRSLQGERDKYKSQVNNLMHSGNGLTYPSCWTTQDGQTEYMFDVTIRDDGLLVRDASPTRAEDPQMRLVQPFDRDTVISEVLFQRATAKVFTWSREEKCRFYSIIRDGTGPTSKERYKQLRQMVESHFYPLLLPVAAPARRPRPTEQAEAPAVGGPYVPVPPQHRAR